MGYFKADSNGRAVIGITLTPRRIADLQAGDTYWIKGEDVGFTGDILVLVGTDEEIKNRLSGNMPIGSLWLPPGSKQ